MRKWLLNFIEITILIVISVACIVVITQSTVLKNKSIFGYRSYVIASNSMYPVFEYGDVILVKDINYDDIKIDDIITYQGVSGELKDKIITHEVIDIFYEDDVKVLKTKGRANIGIDPNVYENQIYGKFAYKFIIISFISKIVRDEVGFVLFIFIPFGILFVLEFINMVKETRRRELEKLVKTQLDELKKIDIKSKELIEIENTMCIQLEEIKKQIDELKNRKKDKNDVEDVLLEKTAVLFNSNDIRKEISKELKLKNKKLNENKKNSDRKEKNKINKNKRNEKKKKKIDEK